jgi:hypothetical protein
MTWILNARKHSTGTHTRRAHTLRHTDTRWSPVHLIWSKRCMLLRHRRGHHVVLRQGLWAISLLGTHLLSRPLWCLRLHTILGPRHTDARRWNARRLHGLCSLWCLLPFGSSRTVGLHWWLVWSRPDIVQVVLAMLALLLQLLVDLGCLRSLVEDLAGWGWPCHVLVRSALHLVSWALHATVVPRLQVSRRALVVYIGVCGGHASWRGVEATKRLQGINRSAQVVLVVACVCSWMGKGHGTGVPPVFFRLPRLPR